jgi:hypothetical protein
MSETNSTRRLIRGAKKIAAYIGDPGMSQRLCVSPEAFHLFRVGKRLAAFSDDLDRIMAAKVAAGASPPPCIIKQREAAR